MDLYQFCLCNFLNFARRKWLGVYANYWSVQDLVLHKSFTSRSLNIVKTPEEVQALKRDDVIAWQWF
jgi:hypothetical protein